MRLIIVMVKFFYNYFPIAFTLADNWSDVEQKLLKILNGLLSQKPKYGLRHYDIYQI